jgi:lipopolysaccharide transport system ATP-binding protein
MKRPVITIESLSKKYFLGQTHTSLLSEKIGNGLRKLYRKIGNDNSSHARPNQPSNDEIWALRDVNLEIHKGEVVGIIGRNGAGKSTLLKIISRITEPTTGQITIEGRIGSLLEVGTGFHQELTGRENIFLNGAILGMAKAEIHRKLDEIVSFSEIEKFLDTPVKRYSSGMYVRLAFAVAAHLEPEILVVDEVLAVGDAAFQKKCLGKMRDVSVGGRTVLFVSHNMTAVRELCNRAVWLDGGRVVDAGETNAIVGQYLHENARSIHEQTWPDPATAPGNDAVRLRRASLCPAEGIGPITVHTLLRVEIEYWNLLEGAELLVSLYLHNIDGTCVFNSDSSPRRYPRGLVREVCHIPGNLLNDGTYRIGIMIVKDRFHGVHRLEGVLVFDVQDAEREVHWYGKWDGVVRPELAWTSEYIGHSEGGKNGLEIS